MSIFCGRGNHGFNGSFQIYPILSDEGMRHTLKTSRSFSLPKKEKAFLQNPTSVTQAEIPTNLHVLLFPQLGLGKSDLTAHRTLDIYINVKRTRTHPLPSFHRNSQAHANLPPRRLPVACQPFSVPRGSVTMCRAPVTQPLALQLVLSARPLHSRPAEPSRVTVSRQPSA